MQNLQMRSWIALCEAVRRGPTFAAIARNPKAYVYTLIDVAAGMQEDLSEWLDDVDDNEDDDDDDDKRYGSIAAQLRESAQKFRSHIKDGKMTVYRGMEVEKNWNPATSGLGVYWTFDRDHAFHGLKLQGIVQESDIDLWETLVMDFTALTEEEVRILPGANILLTSIELNGRPVMRQFWGQSYPVAWNRRLTR